MREILLHFLYHMHQPLYLDHFEKTYLLPWVRLHALKDYFGMAALLREFPDVKVTFNLVPSLLQQLVDYTNGTAHERFQELSKKPAGELTAEEQVYVLKNFFMANRPTMIAPMPRYDTLLQKRGASVEESDLRRVARLFSHQDYLDLQVLQKLVWMDYSYRSSDERIRGLIAKGKNYSEHDKIVLAEVETEILARVIPEYRDGAARGQFELTTTPYYHPILPLICDSGMARVANPRAKALRETFRHPEDAVEQLRRGRRLFRELFGYDSAGLWPSEGSVSMEALALAAAEGFKWAATDEEILEQSLGASIARGADGIVGKPEMLYRPYRVEAGGHSIGLLFRDHVLSDLFGFTYSRMPARDAVADFTKRLQKIATKWDRPGPPVVSVILDGENAWEYYGGDGRDFLRRIYGMIQETPWVRSVTGREVFEIEKPEPLARVAPGSWINHNFDIWLGHDEDKRAWEMLSAARSLLAGRDPLHKLEAAWEEIYIAEGSDWFWWYGGDHSSENDWEFDQLFRKHLINVYTLLGVEAPPELHVSIIAERKKGIPAAKTPTRFLTPKIDGRITSYFEWLGGGHHRVLSHGSSMHKSRVLTMGIWYGFNLEELYVRVDTEGRASTYFSGGLEMALVFLQPAEARLVCTPDGKGQLYKNSGLVAECEVASDSVVELAVPFSKLGASTGEPIEFYVTWQKGKDIIDAQPEGGSIALDVPSGSFEDQYWEV